MLKIWIYSLALSCVFLLNCTSKKPVVSSQHEPNDLAFTFERTACFGTCPVYILSVNISGEATLKAKSNMDLKGTYKCEDCDEQLMAKVVETADEINFWSFKNKYDPGVTDLPSTITTIHVRDTVKRVENIMDGPESLIELEKLIDDLYLKRKWIKQ
jgi:hypothetical protein